MARTGKEAMKATILLRDAQSGHKAFLALWSDLNPWLMAGHRLEVGVRPERRSTIQNSLLWALLTDVSKQVVWHGQKLEPAEWKDIFTASLKRQKVTPGLDGGFVVLGSSTSRMTKAELSELVELIHAFGAQQGVTFNDEAHA